MNTHINTHQHTYAQPLSRVSKWPLSHEQKLVRFISNLYGCMHELKYVHVHVIYLTNKSWCASCLIYMDVCMDLSINVHVHVHVTFLAKHTWCDLSFNVHACVSVSVCMYVCMYVCLCRNWCDSCLPCMHACMYVCMYVCAICMCLCLYACMYLCVYVCVNKNTHMTEYERFMHTYVCIYIHTYMQNAYIRTCIQHMYIYIHPDT